METSCGKCLKRTAKHTGISATGFHATGLYRDPKKVTMGTLHEDQAVERGGNCTTNAGLHPPPVEGAATPTAAQDARATDTMT